MNKLEIKIDEILDALHIFAGNVDQRFNKVDERFGRIEATMVTKDYLDDKLADFRAEWIPIVKKVDTKDSALVVNLAGKKVISRDEEKEILDLSAFPRLN